ncbi:hypothetical protein H4S14_001857 [Agrobacterium vitis]|nr:hypothetical protein [Agrobacterium vitis]MBE1438112.1 hypothetical protein [Agrobacterium vitis]
MAMMKRLAVAGTALAVLASSFAAAQAMPITGPITGPLTGPSTGPMAGFGPDVQTASPVVQVQWRGEGRYYDRGGPGYYRGYRGYDRPRPHYRRHHDGHWYPLAAFAAGALIGGAIASQPGPAPVPRGGNGVNPRHYQWCEARYRSYDAYSNTFVTYSGYRQQCLSPYY